MIMAYNNDKDYLSANHMDFDLSDTDTQPPDDLQSPGRDVEKNDYDQNELANIHDTVAVDDITECGNEFDTQVLDVYDLPVTDSNNETQVVAHDIPVMDNLNETQVVVDEDVLVMDIGNETQAVVDEDIPVINIGNETQVLDDEDLPVMNFGNGTQSPGDGILDTNLFNETQLLDLAGETQRVEEPDCEAYMFTQLLDDNDVAVASDGGNEDSDRTEVLCNSEEASGDSSMQTGDIHTTNDSEKAPRKGDEALLDGEPRPGSSRSDFTTIRVESLRASGLAARRRALERSKSKSLSSVSYRSSMAQPTTEQICIADVRCSPNAIKVASQISDQECNNEQMKEPTSGSRFNICSSTVRKLFPDATTSEIVQPDDAMNDEDLVQFDNGMAGLSYVNSQEPGDLSQANALQFVDNLLKFNISENDEDVEIRKFNVENHKAISSVEGARRLAKTAILSTPFEKRAIFDWDDTLEDEGGGEFLRKNKDLLFENEIRNLKSLTQPRKPRNLNSREGEVIETHRGARADQSVINKNLKSPKSDSRVELRKIKRSVKSSKFVKNLNKDLKRQSITASDNKALDNGTIENEAFLLNVGPDTQIAAEAMETLGMAMPENDFNVVKKTPEEMQKDSLEVGARNKLHTEKRDKVILGDAQVARRQSRRTSSSVLSREVTPSRPGNDKNNLELTREKSSKARRMVTGKCLSEDDGGNSNNVTSATTAGRKKTRGLQDHVGSLTPVARRTRQQQMANQINPDGKETVHFSKEIKDLAGVASRKRSRRDTNPSEYCLAPVEVCDEQFDVGSVPRDLLTDAVEHPRGRRTLRKVQPNTVEASTAYNTRSNRLRSGSTSAVKGVLNFGRAKETDREVKVAADGAEASVRVDSSPRNGYNPSSLACTTPNNFTTPVNDASPICMGDEYHKKSCRKSLSRSPLVKELNSLIMSGAKPMTPDSRKRRDLTDVRVLFSHHLDTEIIRQQKKILLRLGASEVLSMSDATHFITDQFVRTRNMLEAIALGKPVVTHLWLQSCGQASCLIDEKNFILRDAKKEKEIGFSMPVSLARACQHLLLKGQRVLITPNTKPGKDILASLVKAVHGLAIERLGRSALKNETLPDDLLILSCEEDYEMCIPFLEKGAAVYSSELLLNGIVIQKLEYDRHRIFLDAVKRTRSNIWVKRKRN